MNRSKTIQIFLKDAQVHKLKVVDEILKESQTAKLAGIKDGVKNTIKGMAAQNRLITNR